MRILPAFLLLAASLHAADLPAIHLWPNGAPGEKIDLGPEREEHPKDPIAGRPITIVHNVTDPTLTLFRPPDYLDTGAAVLVFPGGGYNILAIDLEGTEVCHWLNSIGVNAVLVKYRVPEPKGLPPYQAPLQDAQRALGIVRSRAIEWGLDPGRIGILGFSAGGHLAAALSNNFATRTYPPVDKADETSCRPDFAILVYPAYLTRKDDNRAVAPELAISAATPPTFLVQTEDDFAHVENSVAYYLALKNAKVAAEMHLFSLGGHGYGLRAAEPSVTQWPALVEGWMRATKMIPRH
jgi:acetyl esterase/lipase